MSVNIYKLLRVLFITLCIAGNQGNAQIISGGEYHGLAICANGSVKAWGRNSDGQLGDGTMTSSPVPVAVSGLSNVIAVSGGTSHSLALKSDGTVWAWGANTYGQLGNGTYTQSSTPVQVTALTGIVAIAAGWGHSVALKNDGTVWAWGDGYFSQLGTGSTASKSPVQVTGVSNIIAISSKYSHTLALKNDSTVWAWGINEFGQIGNGLSGSTPIISQASPVQVFTGATAITTGIDHSLALKGDSTIWGWGRNGFYQLGITGNINKRTPTLSNLSKVIRIYSGLNHNFAIKADGTYWAWGQNNHAQLGSGSTTPLISPYQITSLTNVAAFAAGLSYSFALKSDNTLMTWAGNGFGELCDGTTADRYTPSAAAGLCSILPLAAPNSEMVPAMNKELVVYPNPSNGVLHLNTPFTGDCSVKVMNLTGQIVYQQKLINNQSTIEVSHLKPGIYILEASSEKAGILHTRIEIR